MFLSRIQLVHILIIILEEITPGWMTKTS